MTRLIYVSTLAFTLLTISTTSAFARGRRPAVWNDDNKEAQSPKIVGSWDHSFQETKLVFTKDGTMTRYYEGKAVSSGNKWRETTDGKVYIRYPDSEQYLCIGYIKGRTFFRDHGCTYDRYTRTEDQNKPLKKEAP